MSDLDILPDELKSQSLSDREIVLVYDLALKAIDILIDKKWAPISWEGWVQYPDKVHHGHITEHQGTAPLEQKSAETWEEYIDRCASFLTETMKKSQEEWVKDSRSKDHTLYYCITTIPPRL